MRITLGIVLLCFFASCSDDNGGAGSDAKVGQDQAPTDDQRASPDQPISPDQAVDADGSAPDQIVQVDLGPPKPKDLGPTTDAIKINCNAQVGTAKVTGSVAGAAVKATHAGAVSVGVMGLKGYGIAFLDQGGTCSGLANVVAAPKLWILLCDNKPGTYTVGTSCKPDGGGTWFSFKNQVTIPSPGTDPKATSGTITITSLDTACGKQVKGSFSISFSGDQVSGSFDAVGCGQINP